MRNFLRKSWDFFKRNKVLVKFYALLLYFWLLFYFILHWPYSHKYIAYNLPVFMAKSVAMVLNLLGYTAQTHEAGISLQSAAGGTPFNFSIIYECAGIFGMMIYTAAVIAYPSKLREKLYGLLLGIPGLYLINWIRMVALGIIGLHWKNLFDWFHEWMWQGIFILFVVFFWILWKEKFVKSEKFAPVSS